MSPRGDSPEDPLADLPLRGGPPAVLTAEAPETFASRPPEAAAMGSRAVAFAGDFAAVALTVAAALLAATAMRGVAPTPRGLAWAGAFALYFSFFAITVPLVLFGRTVGLALSGLAPRAGDLGRRLSPSEAVQRWAGTLLTAALLGVPILFTIRDPRLSTPADRLSGKGLVEV